MISSSGRKFQARTPYSPVAEQEVQVNAIMLSEDILIRYSHVTVTWKNYIIVWGGRNSNSIFDPSEVAFHSSGKWFRKGTSGDVLKHSCCSTASVINDEMLVYDAKEESDEREVCIHSLNLNTWIWTKKVPTGTQPSHSHVLDSWAFKDNMYIVLGGNMKVICYNVFNNHWEWPHTKGDGSLKRYNSNSTIINEDTVFVFAGSVVLETNSLYVMDMGSMRWREVPEAANKNMIPCARFAHSLTRISKSAAILVGGYESRFGAGRLDDCWILDLKKASQAIDMSSIWTKAHYTTMTYEALHTAVVEPVSRQIWLIGGSEHEANKIAPRKLQLRLNVSPLRTLASEFIANNTNEDDPEIGPGQLPTELKQEIEAFRAMGI